MVWGQSVTRALRLRPRAALTSCQSTLFRVPGGPSLCFSIAPCRRSPLPPILLGRRGLFNDAIRNSLQEKMDRFMTLNKELAGGQLDPQKLAVYGKEINQLEPLVHKLKSIQAIEEEIKNLEEIITEADGSSGNDAEEFRELAISEREELRERLQELEDEITTLLIPRDEIDDSNAILEVRAGTGGDEAALFTFEIFQMYEKYCRQQGWRWELITFSKGTLGGCKEASAAIKGDGVYGHLKYESGVHRVQRVPINDTKLQTSAMTVAVLPEPKEIDLHISPNDLKIDVYRASGAGGQHVNTTDSAVRITHIPTGTVVAIQDERSQHQNKAKALGLLKARIFDQQRRKQMEEQQQMRNAQIGTGDRSERIRTFNFPQDRITDHRVGLTLTGIDAMMGGEALDDFIEALEEAEKKRKLENLISASQETTQSSSSSSKKGRKQKA